MKRLFVAFIMLMFSVRCWAAAVPVTPMQTAVSSTIQSKMASRGFAANDPRWGATLQASGTAIIATAGAAAVVTAAGITAPAWITAGLAMGLGALFQVGLNLAIDGLKWLLNSDGTVTTAAGASTYPALVGGSVGFTSTCNGGGLVYGSSVFAVGDGCIAVNNASWAFVGDAAPKFTLISCDSISCIIEVNTSAHTTKSDSKISVSGGVAVPAAANCSTGVYFNNTCLAASNAPTTSPLPAAISALTPTQLADAVNPQIVAVIADNAWQQAAATPGYAGIPYDASNPITQADAAQVQTTAPTSWPTVGDAVAPQAAPATGGASPFSLPVTNTAPDGSTAPVSTPTNPSTQPLENLGPDPGIGLPTLEDAPTGQMIMAPLLNLFPSLKTFVVPSHDSTCPKPSIDLYGKHLVLDGHCGLLDGVRPTLAAAMAFVWIAAGLFIVLKA